MIFPIELFLNIFCTSLRRELLGKKSAKKKYGLGKRKQRRKKKNKKGRQEQTKGKKKLPNFLPNFGPPAQTSSSFTKYRFLQVKNNFATIVNVLPDLKSFYLSMAINFYFVACIQHLLSA